MTMSNYVSGLNESLHEPAPGITVLLEDMDGICWEVWDDCCFKLPYTDQRITLGRVKVHNLHLAMAQIVAAIPATYSDDVEVNISDNGEFFDSDTLGALRSRWSI